MKTVTDEILLEQIRQNNESALEQLHFRYYQALCNFSLSFISSIELAEEVVSDVFLNLWIKRHQIRTIDNCRAYLYVAVKNTSYNYLRKNQFIHTDLELIDRDINLSVEPADNEILHSETLLQLDEILSILPKRRRLVFTLNRIEGFKYKEIAEILSISTNTVQKQMTEAIKQLAEHYPNVKYMVCILLSFGTFFK